MERISQHKMENPKIVINVGGVKHEVMWAVLEKRPLTRLGMLGRAQLAVLMGSNLNHYTEWTWTKTLQLQIILN